jgi:hypothetical protein
MKLKNKFDIRVSIFLINTLHIIHLYPAADYAFVFCMSFSYQFAGKLEYDNEKVTVVKHLGN